MPIQGDYMGMMLTIEDLDQENKDFFKYCSKKEATCQTFIKNISAISLYSSYYIFIQRNSQDWDPHLPPIGKVF